MLLHISNALKDFGLSEFFANHLSVFIVLLGIISISYFIHLIRKITVVFFPYLRNFTSDRSIWMKFAEKHRIFEKLYLLAQLIFVLLLFSLIIAEDLPFTKWLTEAFRILVVLLIIGIIASIFSSLLDVVNEVYQETILFAKQKPIKSYLGFVNIIVWIIAAIVAFSHLTKQSPATMLTGLGVVSGVIVLIFRDSILGFISSIQVSAYDIVRIGDWIQMDKHNINGDVIDISLNTAKIRNFDKTVVTVPTYELVANGVINWRGMTEAGGRRIQRAININIDTIKVCDQVLLKKLSKIKYLDNYIKRELKKTPIADNKNCVVNYDKKLTNIGLYREYIKGYLSSHKDIQQDRITFPFLIRQLQSTEVGLPIEIYVFTKTTNWDEYEEIQADIFDHIISVLPLFELRLFQNFYSNK